MTDLAKITFAKPGRKPAGTIVLLAGPDAALGAEARALGLNDVVRRAAATVEFSGKPRTSLDLLAPMKGIDRVVVVGVGNPADLKTEEWALMGGAMMGALGKAKRVTVRLERPDDLPIDPAAAAEFALGVKLRAYTFDKYKAERGGKSENGSDNGGRREPTEIAIEVADVAAVKRKHGRRGKQSPRAC